MTTDFLSQYATPAATVDPNVLQIQKAAAAIRFSRDASIWDRTIAAIVADANDELIVKGTNLGGGHWITIHHEAPDEEGEMVTHICIGRGGTVTAGPRHLIGSNIAHLPAIHGATNSAGKQHNFGKITRHAPGVEPAGARQQPNFGEHAARAGSGSPARQAATGAAAAAGAKRGNGFFSGRGGSAVAKPEESEGEGDDAEGAAPSASPTAGAQPGAQPAAQRGAPAAASSGGASSGPRQMSRSQGLAAWEQHHRSNYVAKHGGDENALQGSGLDHDFFGSGVPYYPAVAGQPQQPAALGGGAPGAASAPRNSIPAQPVSTAPGSGPQPAVAPGGGGSAVPGTPQHQAAGVEPPGGNTGPAAPLTAGAGTSPTPSIGSGGAAGGAIAGAPAGSPAQTAAAVPPEDAASHIARLQRTKQIVQGAAGVITDPKDQAMVRQILGHIDAQLGVAHSTQEGQPQPGAGQTPTQTAAPQTTPSAAPGAAPGGQPQAPPRTAAQPAAPSEAPSVAPTAVPTSAPSATPSATPSAAPSAAPTQAGPSAAPETPSSSPEGLQSQPSGPTSQKPPTESQPGDAPTGGAAPAGEEDHEAIVHRATQAAYQKFLLEQQKGGSAPGAGGASGGGGAGSAGGTGRGGSRGPRPARPAGSTEPHDTDSVEAAAFKAALAHYRGLGRTDLTDEDHENARSKARGVIARRQSRAGARQQTPLHTGTGGAPALRHPRPPKADGSVDSDQPNPVQAPGILGRPPLGGGRTPGSTTGSGAPQDAGAPDAGAVPEDTEEEAPEDTSTNTPTPAPQTSTPPAGTTHTPSAAPTVAPTSPAAPSVAPTPPAAPPAAPPVTHTPSVAPTAAPTAPPVAPTVATPQTAAPNTQEDPAQRVARVKAQIDANDNPTQADYEELAQAHDANGDPNGLAPLIRARGARVAANSGAPAAPAAAPPARTPHTAVDEHMARIGTQDADSVGRAELHNHLQGIYNTHTGQPQVASHPLTKEFEKLTPNYQYYNGNAEIAGQYEKAHGDLAASSEFQGHPELPAALDRLKAKQDEHEQEAMSVEPDADREANDMHNLYTSRGHELDQPATAPAESAPTAKTEPAPAAKADDAPEKPKTKADNTPAAAPTVAPTPAAAPTAKKPGRKPKEKDPTEDRAKELSDLISQKNKQIGLKWDKKRHGPQPKLTAVERKGIMDRLTDTNLTESERDEMGTRLDNADGIFTGRGERRRLQAEVAGHQAEMDALGGSSATPQSMAKTPEEQADDLRFQAEEDERKRAKQMDIAASPALMAYRNALQHTKNMASVLPTEGGRHTDATAGHGRAMQGLQQAFAQTPPPLERAQAMHMGLGESIATMRKKFDEHVQNVPNGDDDRYNRPGSDMNDTNWRRDLAAHHDRQTRMANAITHYENLHNTLGSLIQRHPHYQVSA